MAYWEVIQQFSHDCSLLLILLLNHYDSRIYNPCFGIWNAKAVHGNTSLPSRAAIKNECDLAQMHQICELVKQKNIHSCIKIRGHTSLQWRTAVTTLRSAHEAYQKIDRNSPNRQHLTFYSDTLVSVCKDKSNCFYSCCLFQIFAWIFNFSKIQQNERNLYTAKEILKW